MFNGNKCKIEKTEDFFSAYRKTCKECRKEQNINRTQQNLDSNIELIEKSKENKENLAEVLRKMSVSTVQQIVKHYCIGRHKDDKKDDSIAKIIKHFEQLQSPYKCLGNCGFVLQETFSYCIACKKDPNARKVYIEEKNLELIIIFILVPVCRNRTSDNLIPAISITNLYSQMLYQLS